VTPAELLRAADAELEKVELMMSAATVARFLHVHPETVRAWCRMDRIACILTPTGRYRISRETLEALMKIKTQKSPESAD
jgi:predicted site-specific integrase-resolvase